MNPYTSTWTGVTPGDGPQEVHVVLLDNGRTRALADEVGRQALRCIRCSACLNVCPVYERVGGPRLRLGLPRPDRRDPQPADEGGGRGRADRLAALRLHACAAPATRCARSRSTSRRSWSTCAPRSSTRTGAACRRPRGRRDEGGRHGLRLRPAARLRGAVRPRSARRAAGEAAARGRVDRCPRPADGPGSRSGPGGSARGEGRRERPRGDPGPGPRRDRRCRVGPGAASRARRRPAPPVPRCSTCSPSGSRTTARSSRGARPRS